MKIPIWYPGTKSAFCSRNIPKQFLLSVQGSYICGVAPSHLSDGASHSPKSGIPSKLRLPWAAPGLAVWRELLQSAHLHHCPQPAIPIRALPYGEGNGGTAGPRVRQGDRALSRILGCSLGLAGCSGMKLMEGEGWNPGNLVFKVLVYSNVYGVVWRI